jgi:HAD superfamily hydrolase (TIGR01549 family)
MNIEGVLFDFDDTLTAAGKLDYQLIRREIGCPPKESMLDYLAGIEDLVYREQMAKILDGHEMNAAAEAVPAEGAEELIRWLGDAGLKRGIFTRNSRNAVDRALQNFKSVTKEDFDLIITRDDDLPVKPLPDGVLHAASQFRIEPKNLLVVGDYIYDVEAGRAAGAVTVFLKSRKAGEFTPPESDFCIERLLQIKEICRNGAA